MKKIMLTTAVLASAAALSATGLAAVPVLAEESADAAEETIRNESEIKAEESENEEQAVLTLENSTGKEITYLSVVSYDPHYYPNGDVVLLQEALIEQGFLDDVADGSYGPKTQAAVDALREEKGLEGEGKADEAVYQILIENYSDGNVLEGSLQEGDSAVLSLPEAEEKETENTDTDKPEDTLTPVLQDFDLSVVYLVIFRTADEQEYVVHAIPEAVSSAALKLEGNTAYLEYADEAGETISTYDAEQAVYDMENPVPVYDDYAVTDYYDAGYYYDDPYAGTGNAGDGCIGEGALFNP